MTNAFNIQDEKGNTDVHNATYEGNTAEITRLYHLGAAFNIQSNHGDIPLFIAAKTGNTQLLKEILEINLEIPVAQRIDVNAQRYNGNTLIDVAAHFNQASIIELLLQYQSNNSSAINDLVSNALDIAIEGRSADAVKILQNEVNHSDILDYSSNPLFYAVFLDYKDIAEVLIDNDPSLIGKLDRFNRTVLHEASRIGNKEMMDFLILRGVDQKQVDYYNHTASQTFELYHSILPIQVRQSSYNNITIHEAVEMGDKNIVLDMIKADPGIINKLDQYGKIPLHYVRDPEIVKILCHNIGADDKTVTTLDNFGESPLHLAVSKSDVDVVNEMCNCYGSDINVTNKYGKNLIQYAAHWVKRKARDMIDLIKQKGADINSPDPNNDSTPLHVAAAAKNLEAIKALIANNADINKVDMVGNTPLYISTMCNDTYTTSELVNAGADKDLYNNFGESPIELAQRLNFTAISSVLGLVSLSTMMPIFLGNDKLIAHKANDDNGLITVDNDTSVDPYVAIGTVVAASIAVIGAGVTWYVRNKNSKKAILKQDRVEIEDKKLTAETNEDATTESNTLFDDGHVVDITGISYIEDGTL